MRGTESVGGLGGKADILDQGEIYENDPGAYKDELRILRSASTDDIRKTARKFAPKSKKGVFLGWHMLLGGKWSGDYLVADLADFEAGAPNVRVYKVKELIQPTDITFPLAGIAKHV